MKRADQTKVKTWVAFLLFALAAAVLGGLWGTYGRKGTTREQAPPLAEHSTLPPRTAVSAEEPREVQVLTTQGLVTRRGAADQDWQTVSPGDHLQLEETIKTDKDATVGLRVDEKSSIEMGRRTRMTIQKLTGKAHRFALEEGKVHVRYEENGEREVQISVPGDDRVARTSKGHFIVQHATGTLSVATLEGQARLGDQSHFVEVPAGRLAVMPTGKSPLPVRPIPNSVMLRVDETGSRVQREPFTVISGKTDIGAMVTVNDHLAKVDAQGRFWVRIPLKEGRNRILVITEDVAGNTTRKELPAIVVDSNAPIDQMNIRWRRNQELP